MRKPELVVLVVVLEELLSTLLLTTMKTPATKSQVQYSSTSERESGYWGCDSNFSVIHCTCSSLRVFLTTSATT